MADGHIGKCKECTKLDVKGRYILNPEKIKKYETLRGKSKERIAFSAKHCKEWRARYPDRYKAHCKVNNAVRDGRLHKPSFCEICGKVCKPHAHHADYSRPLEVIWICPECHGQIQ
jgi:hypothetical protein